MVYFNCGNCGTGLRKNQVEQHRYSCRSKLFSCIDCSKDFMYDDYKTHIKCVTESEKYESKKNYVSKANKGELKQNAWFDKVLVAIEAFKGSHQSRLILEKLVNYSNVPRKKPKFFNFMKNSFGSYGINNNHLEEIWLAIESYDINNNLPASSDYQKSNKREHEKDIFNQESCQRKKLKNDELINFNPEYLTENKSNINNKFDWFLQIKNACQKYENNQIKIEKLKKKLFKKYKKFISVKSEKIGNESILIKFNKKFHKKLKSYDSFDLINNNDSNTKINEEKNVFVKYINK